jgi:predicted neutral ceramidase superfamily lipid hydrolase
MQETTRQNYKLISIFIATLATGIPLWTQTSIQIDFTDTTFLAVWLAIGIVASFFTLFVANLKTRDMIGTFIIGYLTAVIIYFVSRILIANQIHSQFILSLAIAIGFGILSGWIGSVAWKGVKKKRKEINPEGKRGGDGVMG